MAVEKNLCTCGDEHMFICFMIFQENTTLRKPYEDYFIDKFKALLKKNTSVAKPPKVAVLNMT